MITGLLLLGSMVLVAFGVTGPAPHHALMRFSRGRTSREVRVALPGLVEAVASGLASGLSLELALAEAATAQPPPLGAATRRAAAMLRLGGSIDDAFRELADIVPAADLAPVVVVLAAFKRAGGRVGRSLARVARLLRGQLALEDERRALSAQGRASATVLVALAPLGAAFFAFAIDDYGATFAGSGRALLALAAGFEIGGAAWLWWLVRLRRDIDDLAPFLDAVVVGLDAGLTFELALAALVSRAPLRAHAEARHLLADLGLGRGARVAFASFAASGSNEAHVAALVMTATRFGAPLADLLVGQADAMRERARRRAEAAARRLPVVMLFPLTLCILPALLIVFLGPPLLSLLR